MLANLAVRELDERLREIAMTLNWTYTRYADDLAFSTKVATSGRRDAMKLVARVKVALKQFGLEANGSKTHVAPPGARRILLGLQVDQPKPHLSRSFKNNLETHLYALTNPKIGVAAHRAKRGFASTIGMRRHIGGLIAFAHQVDPAYAKTLYGKFNKVNWAS
jgi:RNA-directed DNA polymerase